MKDVSITKTNIAAARKTPDDRPFPVFTGELTTSAI
jgi:hypothetical protein